MKKLIIINFASMILFVVGMFMAAFFNLIYHTTTYETPFNQFAYHTSDVGTVMMLVGVLVMIGLSITLFIKRKGV